MSKFNPDVLRKMVENPSGKIQRHVRERADELTVLMRDEAYKIPRGRVARPKLDNMITNTKIGTNVVIGVEDQVDSRVGKDGKSGRQTSITDTLAKKARREKGDSWITRAFKTQKHFKRVR